MRQVKNTCGESRIAVIEFQLRLLPYLTSGFSMTTNSTGLDAVTVVYAGVSRQTAFQGSATIHAFSCVRNCLSFCKAINHSLCVMGLVDGSGILLSSFF